MANIQSNPSWQLDAIVKPIQGDQHHLLISSFVPTARWPQHRVRFSGVLSKEELKRLRDVIDEALDTLA